MGAQGYKVYHRLLRAVVPIATSLTVRGHEHIPTHGPCLLVCNHLSNLDPFCLIASIPRHFHGLAKTELFESWLMRLLIKPLEPIRVARHGMDRQALRQAESYLRQGEPVLVFAEGTRSKTGALQEARAGVVFLAQRTAVPIVPIAISGTNMILRAQFPWYRRAQAQVTIGPPFMLADVGEATRENRHAIAQAVMARVGALLPNAAEQHLPSEQPPTMPAVAQCADAAHTRSDEQPTR